MDDKKNIYVRIGEFLGAVIIGCIAACLIALALALTVKFITFIF